MKSTSDISLWQQFVSGNDEAFSCIYQKYVQVLYQYGKHICSDSELVKDTIQELFTYIYRKRHEISIKTGLESYLFIAFKNLLFKTLTHEQHYTSITEDNQSLQFSLSVEDEFLEHETVRNQKEKIRELLLLLSHRQQEVIYLRYIRELSFEEVCQIMDLNYQSAQNLLQRSFKKIKSHYKPSEMQLLLGILYLLK